VFFQADRLAVVQAGRLAVVQAGRLAVVLAELLGEIYYREGCLGRILIKT